MKQIPQTSGIFQRRNSKQELNSDATAHAARTIIEGETAKRIAKTERLRQARLEKEACAEPEIDPKKKPGRAPKKRANQ
jgi:hypothetical protein